MGRRPPRRMLIKHSFSLVGHRTSVALEAEFWEVLTAAAAAKGIALSALVAAVDSGREAERPLASALRLWALAWTAADGKISVAEDA